MEKNTFGEIAVRSGKASSDQVEQALEKQSAGDPRCIGEIMVEQGAMKPQDVANTLEVQRESRGSNAADSSIRVDVGMLDRLMNRVGELVLARNQDQAVAWVNEIGPEHLHIATRHPDALAERIDNAGAMFLGHYSPVALGDYVAGPSHVLPTGGTARFASGLSANDFLHRSSVLTFTQSGLESLAGDVRVLAEKEGLTAHSASVDIRLK